MQLVGHEIGQRLPAGLVGPAASFFAPAQHAWLVYAVVGGTMVMAYWWCWGKVFKNVGLVVE